MTRGALALLAVAASCMGCHPPPPRLPPAPVATAQSAASAAATALDGCLILTGIADKVNGESTLDVLADEIDTCGPEALALAKAEIRLKQAADAAPAKGPTK